MQLCTNWDIVINWKDWKQLHALTFEILIGYLSAKYINRDPFFHSSITTYQLLRDYTCLYTPLCLISFAPSRELLHDRCLIIYMPNRRLSYQERIFRHRVAAFPVLGLVTGVYAYSAQARLYLAEKYANEVLCPIPVALFSLTGQQKRQEGVPNPVPDPRNAP